MKEDSSAGRNILVAGGEGEKRREEVGPAIHVYGCGEAAS